jgi:hypothetical protein
MSAGLGLRDEAPKYMPYPATTRTVSKGRPTSQSRSPTRSTRPARVRGSASATLVIIAAVGFVTRTGISGGDSGTDSANRSARAVGAAARNDASSAAFAQAAQ